MQQTTTELVASGTEADFNAEKRADIAANFASLAGVDVSKVSVAVTANVGRRLESAAGRWLQAGTVTIVVTVETPTAAAATALESTIASTLTSAATATSFLPGVTVVSTPTTIVQTMQVILPTPPVPPSPSQPTIDVTSFSVEAPSDGSTSSGSMMGIIFGAGGGLVALGLVLILRFYCLVRRKKTAEARVHSVTELVTPMPRTETMEAQPVPVREIMESVPVAIAVEGSGATQERTLVEMSDLLKGQLKLSGSVAQVVTAACEELSVATASKPLVQQAREACAALGM